ncbi:hypothetical protein G6F35_018296 [Rhizopus arrhizus]|nr:hypothetical protein G6F35_018296 [Rhizopus arrhizus]
MRRFDGGGVQGAVHASGGSRAQVVVFQLAKGRQAIVPSPSRVAGVAPSVVILPLAANVDQPVDGAGSAQRAAARPPQFTTLWNIVLP